MKKAFFGFLTAILIQSCSINQQTRQLKALEKCVYQITSADSIYLAGTDISRMVKNKTIDISSMPAIALALLRKNIPLKARINLQITNPASDLAAINQFEYIVLIKDQEIANGFVNQEVNVPSGGAVTVPVQLNSNVYQFLSNGKTMDQIIEFIQGGAESGTEKKGIVTIKIKPTIKVGSRLVKYPGYITIDKEVSSKILF